MLTPARRGPADGVRARLAASRALERRMEAINAGAHKSKKPPQQMMLVVGWFLNFRAAMLFEDLKLL